MDELIGHAKVSCEESASRDGSLLFSPKLLPAHYLPTFQCRESHSSGWFDASVVARFVSMVSLVNCPVVERLLVVCPPGVGRQALHPSRPPATSALAATSSEEEGLHARPLPHIFGEYFCVDAAYHGGGRICTLPSSSHRRFVPRRERVRPSSSQRQWLPRRRRDRPSSSHGR